MAVAPALFRFVAKAALNHVGFGVAGDFAVEVLPEIVKGVWNWWSKDRTPQQMRDEVQAVAALPPAAAKAEAIAAVEAIAKEAPNFDEAKKLQLVSYLTQIPPTVVRSQARPSDPTGKTVSSHLSLTRPEDLIPLLPSRVPKFKAGDHPLPGVDLELVEMLGMGGFGEVWKAKNPHFDGMPPVALKFCLDEKAAKALKNEGRLLAQVQSQKNPAIVPLLRSYLGANPPCLEYEYVAGGELTAVIYRHLQQTQGKANPDFVRKIVRSLAVALSHPHQLKPPIVHRDLKPANVLVQRKPDGTGMLRVTDFGIGGVAASQAIDQANKATTGRGMTALQGAHTPNYASIQQKLGMPPDPRDDVHALGVMWYQMLVGDLNKAAPAGVGWRRSLVERGVTAEELDLVQSCFDEDPDCRPRDAKELAERIDVLIKAVPVVTLASSLNPAIYGQPVTFTAVVKPPSPQGPMPTGTIVFEDGPTRLGSVTLDSGAASLTPPVLSVGSHSIAAKYSGDARHMAGNVPSLNQGVTPLPKPAVSLVSSPNPAVYGQPVTLTARVDAASATGSVSFKVGETVLGSVGLSGGTASLTTSALPAGSYAVVAGYSGDANFAASSSPSLMQTVNPAPLTVKALAASKTAGQANPDFSATFSGFVNGDEKSSLSGTLSFSTPATDTSPPGSYPITPGGLTSVNYAIKFVPGNLVVNAERIIQPPPDPPPTEIERDVKDALEEMRAKGVWETYFDQQGPARVAAWKAAAEQGNVAAQWLFARCLLEGAGVEEDEKAAHAWFRRAADAGFGPAQNDLGDNYLYGQGVEEDPAQALRWYRKAAEQGFGDAELNVAFAYARGRGVKEDMAEAVRWCRKAAERGWGEAMLSLGFRYESGEGIEKDAIEAVRWYRKAAELGHPGGQHALGLCYFEGEGVEQDYPQAIAWVRQAAGQGMPHAQLDLGKCYEFGEGVKKDLAKAADWYRKAAEQDHDLAQLALGYCYEKGHGVAKDLAQAVKWYSESAEQGNKKAKTAKKRVDDLIKNPPKPGKRDRDKPDPTSRSTYLLAWNPKRFAWEDLAEIAEETARGKPYEMRWSCGNRKNIDEGDRLVLIRLGEEPRGIVGIGTATGSVEVDDHWENDDGRKSLYVPVKFDRLLDPKTNPPLNVHGITSGPLSRVNWSPQAGGIGIPAEAAALLEDLWAKHVNKTDGK